MLPNKKKPAFLVDAMLGNIAKKLRLLGYDSEYSSTTNDKDLVLRAKKENRILVTKDTMLYVIAKKQNIAAIQITKNNEIDQLVQIFKNVKLGELVVNANMSRCTICNGELQIIDKECVSNKVPEGVLENANEFWICTNCKKIYWEGTHIKRLQKFVVELNEKL